MGEINNPAGEITVQLVSPRGAHTIIVLFNSPQFKELVSQGWTQTIRTQDDEGLLVVQTCLDSIDDNLAALSGFPGPDDPVWDKLRAEAEEFRRIRNSRIEELRVMKESLHAEKGDSDGMA